MKKIDTVGRIVIPKEYRYALGIENNDEVNIYLQDDKIIISKSNPISYKEANEKAIEYIENNKYFYSGLQHEDREIGLFEDEINDLLNILKRNQED